MTDSEQKPIYVLFIPPKTPLEKVKHFFRWCWARSKTWLYFRWCELRMLFEPYCPHHPTKKLHKGWCVSCEMDEFVREMRLKQLRGGDN